MPTSTTSRQDGQPDPRPLVLADNPATAVVTTRFGICRDGPNHGATPSTQPAPDRRDPRIVQQHFVVADVNASGRHACKWTAEGRSKRILGIGAGETTNLHRLDLGWGFHSDLTPARLDDAGSAGKQVVTPPVVAPPRGTGKRAPPFGLRAMDRFRCSPPRVSGLLLIKTTTSSGRFNKLKRRIATAPRIRNRPKRSSTQQHELQQQCGLLGRIGNLRSLHLRKRRELMHTIAALR
jgi:hypothetical protein